MKTSIGPRTILGPQPALVVGTYGADGRPNLATVSWAGICCSRPPCVAVSLRAATLTHGHVAARRAFTVNVPHERHVDVVDHVGTVSGRDEDKFAACGLTPVRSELVDAPYVAEFPVVLECRLVHTFELGLHTEYVGEILDVKADAEVLGPSGLPALSKVRPVVFSSAESTYYSIGEELATAFARRAKR